MTKKYMTIVLVVILLLWIAPALMAVAAGGLASALGCQLNEGSVHPCMLFGSEIGGTLYMVGVLGWLTIIDIPFVAAALVVWAIVAVILSRRNKAS